MATRRLTSALPSGASGSLIPNFDRMTEEQLMAFWKRYTRPSRADAEALVGDRRHGFTNIASLLASYALAKACAIGLRREGNAKGAAIYQSHCDLYYAELPADLRFPRKATSKTELRIAKLERERQSAMMRPRKR
jgi:hypothetical protein